MGGCLTLWLGCAADVGAVDQARAALARGEESAAFDQFLRRAENGDPIAQNNVGVLWLKGRGTGRDPAEARRWFQAAADEGLPGAMHNLGVLYLRGHGTEPDPARAAEWFTKAAELGDADAQFYLARLFYQGEGMTQDLTVARDWFTRAADQGLPAARFNVALMLLRGQGGAPDEARALSYLQPLAAENEAARLLIAQIHLMHAADPARAALALAGLRPLAEAGNPEAQYHLGMMLMLGQGLAQDYEEGRFWLQQASRAGFVPAQVNLAGLYERGLGVEPDPVEAVAWYEIAVSNGDAAAATLLARLREDLSPPERARAEALTGELRARHPDIVRGADAPADLP
ncbi:MAG: hypothetical protein RL434_2680 [Pseudomonadota bacterium]